MIASIQKALEKEWSGITTLQHLQIARAIDAIIHNFNLLDHSFTGDKVQESIKEAIEHRKYTDRYYRKMNHNEFSPHPVPALVTLNASGLTVRGTISRTTSNNGSFI